MENNNKSKIALAIVAGIAAGVATWYFMGSEKGKQNWISLIDIAKELSDKMIAAGDDKRAYIASAGRDVSDYIGHQAVDTFNRVKSYS